MLKKPLNIAQSLCDAGLRKIRLPLDRALLLAALAGSYIGFGAHLSITVSMDMQPILGAGLSKLVSGAVFSVGLMLIVIGGAELFTGNNLIILSCLAGRSKIKKVLRSWAIVYVGNFIGSLLLVYLIYLGGFYNSANGALGIRVLSIANAKVNQGFIQLVARGILCNWLVCLAVWMASSTEDIVGKMLACLFPITAFVASGYEHCIANMFFVPMGILLKNIPNLASEAGVNIANLNWMSFVTKNLLPVTIGNLIGGVIFVATTYWYVYLRQPSLRVIKGELRDDLPRD
ncbi:MAG: formate/nitrite transporter family protein [Candidatus Bathyarchaeia archaeon]